MSNAIGATRMCAICLDRWIYTPKEFRNLRMSGGVLYDHVVFVTRGPLRFRAFSYYPLLDISILYR